MIQFGLPTLLETDTIESCVLLAKKVGLKFVEINMNMPQFGVGKLQNMLPTLQEELSRQGIYFTFHLEENFNIADFNDKVSDVYFETMLAVIEAAKTINAPIINIHMAEGIYFKLPNEKIYLFEKYSEYYMDKLLKFREICDKAISDSDIKICIENTGGFLPFMKQGIEFLLKSKNFGLTLDIGHDHSAGYFDADFINKHQKKLCHMHIHDAVGQNNHLPLGTGEIDLDNRLLLAIKNNCRCVIEVKTVQGLQESVDWLRDSDYK